MCIVLKSQTWKLDLRARRTDWWVSGSGWPIWDESQIWVTLEKSDLFLDRNRSLFLESQNAQNGHFWPRGSKIGRFWARSRARPWGQGEDDAYRRGPTLSIALSWLNARREARSEPSYPFSVRKCDFQRHQRHVPKVPEGPSARFWLLLLTTFEAIWPSYITTHTLIYTLIS